MAADLKSTTMDSEQAGATTMNNADHKFTWEHVNAGKHAAQHLGNVYKNETRGNINNYYGVTPPNSGEREDDEERNKHFDVPKTLTSCYVGREQELSILGNALLPSTKTGPPEQKRFVVYGMGGSGKTQFCCKFAHDHQEQFWGVFWIDGRNHEQLKATLISNVGAGKDVAKNHNAALQWLSNQKKRWLLIIDNADDVNIDITEYFPKGTRGCILITTRNPYLRTLGNTGNKWLKFEGMRTADAIKLLLHTAGLATDLLGNTINSLAGKIVKALGSLAIAITMAGHAIAKGVCKIENYLAVFEEIVQEKLGSHRRRDSQSSDEFERTKKDMYETTFQISYTAIKVKADKGVRNARDALELLQTFAFLHCEHVRYDFLSGCIQGNRREKQSLEEASRAAALMPQSWRRWVFENWIWLMTWPQRSPVSTVLPNVLRNGLVNHRLDEGRVRDAMLQLTQYSLVSYHEKTDSWSMHPLVHKWARDVLPSSCAEQHIWCESAATLLSECIVFGQNEEEFMRHLLPHVEEVRSRQATLGERMRENRDSRTKPWPFFGDSSFSPQRMKMLAKFSFVYLHNGIFEKAEKLQSNVQQFTVNILGWEDPKTRAITMLLATTQWNLGKSDDSAKLLELLLDKCERIFGPDHRDTYMAKLKLAESRLQQARVPDARRLCEEALFGLEELCGPEDEETLNAMDVLAGALVLTGRPKNVTRAQGLHRQAWETRERLRGPEDIKTLDSRQSYYTTTFWKGDHNDHLEAEKGMAEIVEIRKRKQGSENPFTLLSMLYHARVKVELQDYDGAQDLLDYGLPIAQRDYGPNHVAVLFCRYHIGRMRVRQGKWAEARDILIEVCERQKSTLQGWGRWHYDRIGGLLGLAKVKQELGEYEECDDVVKEAMTGFELIATKGQEHPWLTKLLANWKEWKKRRPASVAMTPDTESTTSPLSPSLNSTATTPATEPPTPPLPSPGSIDDNLQLRPMLSKRDTF